MTEFILLVRFNNENKKTIIIKMESLNYINKLSIKTNKIIDYLSNINVDNKLLIKKKKVFMTISSLKGWRLVIIEHYIKDLIKNKKIFSKNKVQLSLNGQKINAFNNYSKKRKLFFLIEEEYGIRLALLFETIKNIKNITQIDKILNFTRSIPKEEIYYWFSKCFLRKNGRSNLRAYKILALS
ncbi:MAG: DUF7680 family protein [Promethearchaeia archaeon]